MIPGRTLRRLAKLILPPHVCEQVVDAQLADFQHEWTRSAKHSRALVLLTGYHGFWRMVISCGLDFGKMEASDRQSFHRALAVGSGMTVLAIAWWALPHALGVAIPANASAKQLAQLRRLQVRLLNTWITGMLPIAVAFGAAAGIATLRTLQARRMRLLILLGAIATSSALGLAVGWILPLSNHAVNVAMGGCCSKWPMENTLGELRHQPDLLLSYYITIAAPWATLVMAFFGLSIVNFRWAVRIALTLGVCWLYRVLVFPAEWPVLGDSMPLAVEAWVANLTVTMLAVVSILLNRRRPAWRAARPA
jgi:hypothetical protein